MKLLYTELLRLLYSYISYSENNIFSCSLHVIPQYPKLDVNKAHFLHKVLAFTDGETVSMMLPAQDHKRIGDGDTGPNTGGMGAYAPCPLITRDQLADVKDQVLQRAIDGLKAEGIKYVGELLLK